MKFWLINGSKKKAKFIGNYSFKCNSCHIKEAKFLKFFEVFVMAAQLTRLRKLHENHDWVIRSEFVLSKSHLAELKRIRKK
jgi:hypothetical protein